MSKTASETAPAPAKDVIVDKDLRKHPFPPLKLYQDIFCRRCDVNCNPTETRFKSCILALIADELTRIRQLLQQRARYQSW
jgi:hypothetical protein